MNKKDFKDALKKVTDRNIIAWEAVLSKLLSFRSRSYCIKKNSKVSKIYNKCQAFSIFEYKYGYLAKEEMLVGRFTKSLDDIDKTRELILAISQYVKDPFLCDLTTSEVLTKVLAYRNLQPQMEIEIPVIEGHEIKLEKYKVDKVFNLWNTMRAFGLKSLNDKHAPILLFRGTQFSLTSSSSRTSIISNFDPEGPGLSVYQHARPTIQRWLKKVCKGDLKARTMGYSLGGALTSYAIIMDPEFFSKNTNETSYAFHQPGVCPILYEKWHAIPEEEKPKFVGFVAEGDFVSKYGRLFDKTYELITDKELPPIESHTSLFFIKNICTISEIELEEENASSSRRKYSKFHETTSSLIYKAGIKFLLPNDDDIIEKNESS